MSRRLSKMQAMVLGLATILSLAMAAIGIFAAGSQHWLWGDRLHLRVVFPRIQGVATGTRVRVLGKEAGVVDNIELSAEPPGQVILSLRLDGSLREFIRRDATVQILPEGMVGGKVLELNPGTINSLPVKENDFLASRPTPELGDLMAKVQQTLDSVVNSQGSLAKLIRDDEAHRELIGLLRQAQATMASFQQDADAIKALPIIRNYVNDPYQQLVRSDLERSDQWFPTNDLFEAGSAVLTEDGRRRLDSLVPWLEGSKQKGSEVVIAAYADPGLDSNFAGVLAQRQSEAVRNYLTGRHGIHKLGWFSRRKVICVGCNGNEPMLAQRSNTPMPRIEVVVFLPRNT
jgi:phospholipid/cholesterol/gamma-HCH transport system substrate-binding protein